MSLENLQLRNIAKEFNSIDVLKDICLEIQQGETVALLGANGSGKSTLLKIIAGILSPDHGQVLYSGQDIRKLNFRSLISYIPENNCIYHDLSVTEYLLFTAKLNDVSTAEISAVMELFELSKYRNQLCGTLSKGLQQRVALAQALLPRPQILIMDEPNTGLDPKQLSKLNDILRHYAEGMLTLMSTHQVQEAKELCDRFIGISGGEIIFDLSTEQVSSTEIYSLY